jgi:hypothetical protein
MTPDDIFEEIALVIGGVFAHANDDDETLWTLMNGLSRLHMRWVREREPDGWEKTWAKITRAHPEVERYLRELRLFRAHSVLNRNR